MPLLARPKRTRQRLVLVLATGSRKNQVPPPPGREAVLVEFTGTKRKTIASSGEVGTTINIEKKECTLGKNRKRW